MPKVSLTHWVFLVGVKLVHTNLKFVIEPILNLQHLKESHDNAIRLSGASAYEQFLTDP